MTKASQVAIVGGGPAGAVAALVLARRGVPVTVLETVPSPVAKAGETLPPGLGPLLRKLGLEPWLERDGHLRSQGNRSLWGSAEPGESPFLSSPHGEGWHVDRRRFEQRLAEAACEAGATWQWGSRVERCEREGESWRLQLGQEVLHADFVADATGRAAHVARRLGARRLRYDRLVGISALLSSPSPAEDSYTLVEATPDGWWYSALLGDGRLAVAFLTDGDLLDRHGWWERLWETKATRERVETSGYQLGSELRTLPAESSRLDRIAGEGWLALGDAAAAYDPLSSYGVASAMASGFYGGHAIADLLAGRSEARLAYMEVMQRAFGTCLDLQREHYARERRWPEAPFWQRRHSATYGLEPLTSASAAAPGDRSAPAPPAARESAPAPPVRSARSAR